jgi:hypothetical protein
MKKIFFYALVLSLCSAIFAEPQYSEDYGFILDLPAAYVMTEGNGVDAFNFSKGENEFTLRVYEKDRFSDARAALQWVTSTLKSSGELDSFQYNGLDAAFCQLSFSNQALNYSGWALALPLEKGLLTALAYSTTENNVFNLSALDSIAPRAEDYYTPGPVTAYTYPGGRAVQSSFMVPGTGRLNCTLDASDEEASLYVVERENIILQSYALDGSGEADIREAWTRFYRMIFRDAYKRMAPISASVLSAFNPQSQSAYISQVLDWVQNFSYERNTSGLGADLVNPLSAVLGARGDCDSRALVMDILLWYAGVDAQMMISRTYGHAMALVDTEGEGARFNISNTPYLVAETTTDVPIGQIAASMADPQYWWPITF